MEKQHIDIVRFVFENFGIINKCWPASFIPYYSRKNNKYFIYLLRKYYVENNSEISAQFELEFELFNPLFELIGVEPDC